MIRISEERVQTISLLFIAGILTSASAFWLRPVLVPFVVAVFIVSGISPILDLMQKYIASSRMTAAVITFLLGCILIVMLMAALWGSVVDLASHADQYEAQVEKLITESREYLPWKPEPIPEGAEKQSLEEFVKNSIEQGAGKLSQVFLDLLSTSVIVLIYVFFLLMGNPTGLAKSQVWQDVDWQIRSYISLKTTISLFTGIIYGIALWLLGVPMAIVFGMLAFLLNFIPNVGPVIASLLPIPLIILHPEAPVTWMVSAIVITSGIQFLSGNVIEPRLMGKSSDLHPIVVLLALMFWGMMWGIVGMFLATPITAGIRIGLSQFEVTEPFAEILAGRLPKSQQYNDDESETVVA